MTYGFRASVGASIPLWTVAPWCSFRVPAGSATHPDGYRNINLKMRIVREVSSGYQVHQFDFGPEGMNFSADNPAVLHLPAASFLGPNGQMPTALIWVYYNEESGEWDLEEVIRVSNDGFFHIPIYHFSSYRSGLWGDWLSQGGQ
jgi:hypothetical protein